MSAPAIELRDVVKRFGRTEIIRGLNLEVRSGERHAVIGPNGAGKSTMFNLVSGRLQPSSGTIRMKGEDVTRLKSFEINRRGLSRSFQVTNIFPKLSVWREHALRGPVVEGLPLLVLARCRPSRRRCG